MDIIVLGGRGLLGRELCKFLSLVGHRVFTAGTGAKNDFSLDITCANSVNKLFDNNQFQFAVNLVAITDVDHCEKSPRYAFEVNCLGVKNISEAINNNSRYTKLIHVSTDAVYDRPGLNVEEDTKIQNMYAFSKLCGEPWALKCNGLVLRTNFFGFSVDPEKTSFSDWVFKKLQNDSELFGFDDVMFSPLSMQTVCQIIHRVITTDRSGVFNLGSSQGLSKGEAMLVFASALGFSNPRISLGPVEQYVGLSAKRPRGMLMNCQKFEDAFNIKLPKLTDEIKKVANSYKQAYGLSLN